MPQDQRPARPPFLISAADVPEIQSRYPGDDEPLGFKRALGKAAGLTRLGVNLKRIPAGQRSTWPHAEADEEEFAYVLQGELLAWIDGEVYPMKAGDFAAFRAGSGVSHTFINDSDAEAVLLIGGEADRDDSRIDYPLHPEYSARLPAERRWVERPKRPLGPHDGKPQKR